MNERIRELALQAQKVVGYTDGGYTEIKALDQEKFAELIVRECIGILETEIELVKGYKSTACNDFDVRWHKGKIEHFAKLIEKNKKHFGVE
jgi:hypothetical protein